MQLPITRCNSHSSNRVFSKFSLGQWIIFSQQLKSQNWLQSVQQHKQNHRREMRKSWLCQFAAAKEWGRKAVITTCPCLHPCPHFSEAAVTSHMQPFPGPGSCGELHRCVCSVLPAGAFVGSVMGPTTERPWQLVALACPGMASLFLSKTTNIFFVQESWL